jgi:hypothetical protein
MSDRLDYCAACWKLLLAYRPNGGRLLLVPRHSPLARMAPSAKAPTGGRSGRAGMPVVRVETEVGSGTNGTRSRVRRLLADPTVTIVVVEHRDRLARLNAELVEAALSAHGRRLVVVDDGEVTDDLVRDMVEVLTSFCAGLYGRRSARNRALKALRCARSNVGVAGR